MTSPAQLEPVLVRIPNWNVHQHYKTRNPPWIKLHRTLIETPAWGELSGDASKTLVECLLVASESGMDGTITGSLDALAWRLRRAAPHLLTCLQSLDAQGFIELCQHPASSPQAER